MQSSSIVEIDQLRFAYGDRALLTGVSLAIPRGKGLGMGLQPFEEHGVPDKRDLYGFGYP